ncbi:hypothetical protein LZ554_000247 [Drepanopeziza brunnea f. sp. 'monogermtubi']|nr:hypothetical protein LZ554_000247 [Drepanopeziza brunnea f. sp. 'monogermtubi']
MLFQGLALTAALANLAAAHTPSAVVPAGYNAGVPTGTPVPGDYNGQWRPQIHFSPPSNFMNDPNGCFLDANGTWHLYYQYNPARPEAGNQHWGHATSKDLYTWENQPIALYATEDTQIYSGSVVIDTNNTSGFFPNQDNGVVAIYTLNTADEQTQAISYSFDGGYTFVNYTENPVLRASPPSPQFRDPKVIWYEDHWVMSMAYSQDFVVGIFTSPDLKNWTHASNFTTKGVLGLQYECPNLIRMPVLGEESMWLMVISINPGGPIGGSFTQYFPGTFNGTHFEAVDDAARILDFTKDNYAGQFFYGLPDSEDPVFIGWASNWQYTNEVPTGEREGWRSSMTLPRRAHLVRNVTRTGWALVGAPYDLAPLHDTQLALDDNFGNGTILADYSSVSSGALYFQVNVTGLPRPALARGSLNFTFSASSTRESISGGFYFGGVPGSFRYDNPFWVSRHNLLGFAETNPFFTNRFSNANVLNPDGTFTLEGVIDRSMLEVFLDGGRSTGTTVFYPEGVLDTMDLRIRDLNDGVVVSVAVWGLKSTWAGQASEDGIVYGNVTTPTGYAAMPLPQ